MRSPFLLFPFALFAGLTAFCGFLLNVPDIAAQRSSPAVIDSLPPGSKRYALLIGVDTYEDGQISRLENAANDAKEIARALVRYAGFPPDHVTVLASGNAGDLRPTRGNILRRLSNLRSIVPTDGLLVIGFAGHGIERDQRVFLLPADAQLGEDTSLLEDTALSAQLLTERIRETGVRQVLLFLDACRNDPQSARGESQNRLTGAYTKALDFYESRNRDIRAFAIIYATEVGQRAYEFKAQGQGYFTWALVEALRGKAANQKGDVTLGSLVNYLQETVPRKVSLDLGRDKKQRPFAIIEGFKAGDLVLAGPSRTADLPIAHDESSRDLFEEPRYPATPASDSIVPAQGGNMPGNTLEPVVVWNLIRGSNEPPLFESFIELFPNAPQSALARQRLQSLQDASARQARISSGSSSIGPAQQFDLDSGKASSGPDGPAGDLLWADSDGVRFLIPQGRASLSVLGRVDFDAVSLEQLRTLYFSDEALPAAELKVRPQIVVAVRTNEGRYSKIVIESADRDLRMSWVTFP